MTQIYLTQHEAWNISDSTTVVMQTFDDVTKASYDMLSAAKEVYMFSDVLCQLHPNADFDYAQRIILLDCDSEGNKLQISAFPNYVSLNLGEQFYLCGETDFSFIQSQREVTILSIEKFIELIAQNEHLKIIIVLSNEESVHNSVVDHIRRNHIVTSATYSIRVATPATIKHNFEKYGGRLMQEDNCMYLTQIDKKRYFYAKNICFCCNEYFEILEEKPVDQPFTLRNSINGYSSFHNDEIEWFQTSFWRGGWYTNVKDHLYQFQPFKATKLCNIPQLDRSEKTNHRVASWGDHLYATNGKFIFEYIDGKFKKISDTCTRYLRLHAFGGIILGRDPGNSAVYSFTPRMNTIKFVDVEIADFTVASHNAIVVQGYENFECFTVMNQKITQTSQAGAHELRHGNGTVYYTIGESGYELTRFGRNVVGLVEPDEDEVHDSEQMLRDMLGRVDDALIRHIKAQNWCENAFLTALPQWERVLVTHDYTDISPEVMEDYVELLLASCSVNLLIALAAKKKCLHGSAEYNVIADSQVQRCTTLFCENIAGKEALAAVLSLPPQDSVIKQIMANTAVNELIAAADQAWLAQICMYQVKMNQHITDELIRSVADKAPIGRAAVKYCRPELLQSIISMGIEAQSLVEEAVNINASVEVFDILKKNGALLSVVQLRARFDVIDILQLKYTTVELKTLKPPLTMNELLLVQEQVGKDVDIGFLCGDNDMRRALSCGVDTEARLKWTDYIQDK